VNKNLKPGWSYKKLDELGFVGRGKSKHRPRNDPSLYGGKHPFIQTAEVTASEFYIIKYSQTYSDLGLAQSKLWDKNTLCIVNAGENTAETAILKFKACFPDSIIGFIANSEKADVRFIKYYLTTIKPQLRSITKGATQDNLSVSKLLLFDILTPPLPIQRKIAGILLAYDRLIENNTRRIEILEEMARSIYREWFVKFRFPGHEQVQMVDSELGLIPEGWEVKYLPDICSKVIDGTHDSPKPVDEGYYLVTGKHIVNGFIDFSKCYFISPEEHEKVMKRSKPQKGDTIFSNIGTLGSTAFVTQDFEFSIKNVALFKPLKEIYSCFIYLYFSSNETLEVMEKKASGTSQRFFSLKLLRGLELVTPPDSIFSKFDRLVRPILEQRTLMDKKNQSLRRTRDLLLPRLISGEIDVENLDIKISQIAA
jgi:type I restriction enzyme S subunit